jgi:ketosteroid isomerase-like protein
MDSAGCGFLHVRGGLIVGQRGYWDSSQLNEIHPDVHPD